MSIDPRLKERRRVVAEDRARRKIGRLLKLIVALVLGGIVAWILLSPWLERGRGGHRRRGLQRRPTARWPSSVSSPAAPMILIRPGQVENALLADPWVKDATVVREWPDRLIVQVEERTALAWVETGGGWAHHAVDGVALPSPDTPDDELAWIQLPEVPLADTESSREVLGALEFVAGLARGIAGRDHDPDAGERGVLGRGVRLRGAGWGGRWRWTPRRGVWLPCSPKTHRAGRFSS